ncbi:site-specific DNA-methyltransferase (cytosine-N(4)-specific) [Sphingomonas antarctica]|uniref:DNA methyltransferase n=1 Tax=Sphingomonas antarctica TaxID=2040274 RepID=UPI0039EA7613
MLSNAYDAAMAMRQANLFYEHPAGSIVDQLSAFTYEGKRTERIDNGDVPYFYNEFWTARQRDAHPLQEVSYRACFKAQLPEFFIKRLTEVGDRVYDPFMGRGTTLIQAALMGRDPVGNDVNPISKFLCRPRICPPTIGAIADRLRLLDWQPTHEHDDELLVFYHPETLREIMALRQYLLRREAEGSIDPVDDWIRMVALNRLTGHSPGFFSVYSLPPNQAVTLKAQIRINEKRGQIPPRRHVAEIILKKSRSLLKDGVPPKVTAQFSTGPAESTPDVASASVNLVVTSPPFLDIVQYAADNWLRCWFAGIDVGGVEIAMHRKAESWQSFVRSTFEELERVVRPGGHVAFEVGEVRNGKVELDKIVLEAIRGLAFEPLLVLINVQEFTKTANVWGVNNNAKGTNTNRIILARRL